MSSGFARALCVLVHFFRPLQNNNVNWLNSAYFGEREARRFYLELIAVFTYAADQFLREILK